jgi:hypothetical protein
MSMSSKNDFVMIEILVGLFVWMQVVLFFFLILRWLGRRAGYGSKRRNTRIRAARSYLLYGLLAASVGPFIPVHFVFQITIGLTNFLLVAGSLGAGYALGAYERDMEDRRQNQRRALEWLMDWTEDTEASPNT